MRRILLAAALLPLAAAVQAQHHEEGRPSNTQEGGAHRHVGGKHECKACKRHGRKGAKKGACKACRLRGKGGSGPRGGFHPGGGGGEGGPHVRMRRWIRKGGGGFAGGYGKPEGLDRAVAMKGRLLLMHRSELKLTPEQQDGIAEAIRAAEKKTNTLRAEIDNLKIDIREELKSETLDAAKVKRLIDKKHDAKAKLAKLWVDVQAGMQGVLTKEQLEEIREFRYGLKDKTGSGEAETETEIEEDGEGD